MSPRRPSRSRERAGPGAALLEDPLAGFRPRLLCVDDDPAVLSSLARVFRQEPCEVVAAETSEDALRLVDRGDVALVLADQRMPGMSGVDLLSEVRRRSPATRRVLLTGFPGSTAVGAGLRGDVEWLISKPWNDDALRLAVGNLLREDRDPDRAAALRAEIEARLGAFPAFFRPALDSPEVLEDLWRRTESAELDSPIPVSLRERLFAYLSRFCRSPYLIYRHSAELRRRGMSGADILSLIETPAPALEIDVAADLDVLDRSPIREGGWPEAGGEVDRALFRCAVCSFLSGASAVRCRLSLRGALGPDRFNRLTAFLSHVRSSHEWTEAHPEIVQEDREAHAALLEELRGADPKLAEYLEKYVDRVRQEREKTEDKLLEVIRGLRKREAALRSDQDQLETRIQERTTELMAEILERKRAEEELRQTNVILENALEGIARVDPEGRCVSANKAFSDLFGRSPEEILGRTWEELVHPEDRERLAQARDRMRREGKAEAEARARKPDGSIVHMHVVKIRALDKEGHYAGHYRFTKDLTERKEAEEERGRLGAQLLQGQKLQAIGQLAAGVAHEINNPVGYILSNMCTLESYCADTVRLLDAASALGRRIEGGTGTAKEAAEFLRIRDEIDVAFLLQDFPSAVAESRQGAERIRDIVKSLREFSHVDEGNRKPTDVVACLEDALRICWNELKYKAEIERDFGPVPLVPGYPQRLSQVFLNLLVNAAQAMEEKRGKIRLSTSLEGGHVVVRIRDDGSGIAEENLKRLFEPFFTTKPVGKGTGLGLYVAYRIVNAHRGTIEVASAPGQGSEFAVSLPVDGGRTEGDGEGAA